MNYSHSYLSQQSSYSQSPHPPNPSSQQYQNPGHQHPHYQHHHRHSSSSSSRDESHTPSAQSYALSHPQAISENDLALIFHQCDKDGDGYLNAQELQCALAGSFTPFSLHVCAQLINIFDPRHRGVKMDSFGTLWKHLVEWHAVFRSFDKALNYFGHYGLSPSVAGILLNKYDRLGKGFLLLEDFIQCCIIMQTVTWSFRDMDRDQDGFITISYEQFVNTVISIAANQ